MERSGSAQAETNLSEIVAAKVEMMKQGQVVEAAAKYFAEDAETVDFDGTITKGRDEMQREHESDLKTPSVKQIGLQKMSNSGT